VGGWISQVAENWVEGGNHLEHVIFLVSPSLYDTSLSILIPLKYGTKLSAAEFWKISELDH